MAKDWSGNAVACLAVLGARNYAKEERQEDDYYATPPQAVELLLEQETFSPQVWEPACGAGHISNVLIANGYDVLSTDVVYRGYGQRKGVDFLEVTEPYLGDIITNLPYKFGLEFVEKALKLVRRHGKVAMFLKLQFLEGKARKQFFAEHPPRVVYVSSGRFACAKNGDFKRYKHCNAVAYAWYVWEKGYKGAPCIKWIN